MFEYYFWVLSLPMYALSTLYFHCNWKICKMFSSAFSFFCRYTMLLLLLKEIRVHFVIQITVLIHRSALCVLSFFLLFFLVSLLLTVITFLNKMSLKLRTAESEAALPQMIRSHLACCFQFCFFFWRELFIDSAPKRQKLKNQWSHEFLLLEVRNAVSLQAPRRGLQFGQIASKCGLRTQLWSYSQQYFCTVYLMKDSNFITAVLEIHISLMQFIEDISPEFFCISKSNTKDYESHLKFYSKEISLHALICLIF